MRVRNAVPYWASFSPGGQSIGRQWLLGFANEGVQIRIEGSRTLYSRICGAWGFDHGAGHPRLFLDDAKAPNCQKNNGFNDLGNYSEWPKVAGAVIQAKDCLRDTKGGFTYYINEMTDDVEKVLKGGNPSEIEAAQKIFERKIQPQYGEFRRQLAAKKTGFWSKVLAADGKFFQVNAAP